MTKFLSLTTPAVMALILGTTASSAAQPPGAYYLALGDSITYGIQPAKVSAGLPPAGFRTGYVDVVAARLRALAPKLRVVNYGCPGESTKTFVTGGCPWLAGGRKLHDPHRGAQLAAALAFLRAHRGEVSPITLTLWGNDVSELSEACDDRLACVQMRAPRAMAQFANRMTAIVRQLRAAAPTAAIVVTGTWNTDVARLKTTDPLFRSLNTTIAKVAARARARFANTFPVFNPQGSVAGERARICSLTFTCSQGDDHPTNAGYKAIAKAVLVAAGH